MTTEMRAIGGRLTAVTFRRSARARKISLRIDARAEGVLITLPARASHKAGLDLLAAHESWAAEKLAALPPPLRFCAGAVVPVNGVPHEIVHAPGARGGAWAEAGCLYVTGGEEFLPRRVTDFLKREARTRLTALVAHKAAAAAVKPAALRIKDTRSRWGSCAPDRTLAFSWRLICAPDYVQDYVVAHEVAHLRHMNHGPSFWALCADLSPHKAAASAWLGAQGLALLRMG
jgi:predicted metal-dependent hydrolase